MLKEVFMNATWLASAILALVGILKMPFKSFKEKKPKLYRATFFIISLILVVGGSIVVDMFILEKSLLSWTFAMLLVSTGCVVFGGYMGYEATGLKAGFHKFIEICKNWANSDKKVAKIIKKIGMDRIVAVNDKTVAAEQAKTINAETVVGESVENPAIVITEQKNL